MIYFLSLGLKNMFINNLYVICNIGIGYYEEFYLGSLLVEICVNFFDNVK